MSFMYSTMNFAFSTVSRARFNTICSVSSVMSSALYIFSNWCSSSCSYSNVSLATLRLKSTAFSAKGRSTSRKYFRSSSAMREARWLASMSKGVILSRACNWSSLCCDGNLGQIQVRLEVGDRLIEFLGLQGQQHVALAHLGAVRDGALDHQRGPFLGLDENLLRRLRLEDALQIDGDLQRPPLDRVGGRRGGSRFLGALRPGLFRPWRPVRPVLPRARRSWRPASYPSRPVSSAQAKPPIHASVTKHRNQQPVRRIMRVFSKNQLGHSN